MCAGRGERGWWVGGGLQAPPPSVTAQPPSGLIFLLVLSWVSPNLRGGNGFMEELLSL